MSAQRILLLPGRTKVPDRPGHHDYAGGCALLAALLVQTPGVEARVEPAGWPEDEAAFEGASALAFYTGGGGKQGFLQDEDRVRCMERLVDGGVGLVLLHQTASFPPDRLPLATRWLGGAHVAGRSGRGHWRTRHEEFPSHPVTRGVRSFAIRDGWLNEIQFAAPDGDVTPLVWSGRRHRGSPRGGPADVVAWAYQRPRSGRSFCYTGLDAHSAWQVDGIRQLVVNGVLWSAGLEIPATGAPCALTAGQLDATLTPRGSGLQRGVQRLRRGIRRAVRAAHP